MDAGPLYAYVDADDQHHEACADLLETHPGPLVVPTLVITEVVYLLGTRLGTRAELRFLADMVSGVFDIEPVHPADWLRMADLVERYADLPLGAVDASVVACAERLGVDEVATVARRHFTIVKSNRQLTLWP
ncbi:MAG TPA: PIN domain-containing protein [Micromonosporaceae bacterium]|nr:PIN domain-containing protein [Micromonosporaceae bacterium]